MKLKFTCFFILSLMLSACGSNYDSYAVNSNKTADSGITSATDLKKWLLPDDDDIANYENSAVAAAPKVPTMAEASNPIPNQKIQKVKKSVLAGRLPSYPQDFKEAGYLKPTVYYIPLVNEMKPACSDEQMVPMVSTDGKAIAKVCPKTHDGCALQGSCFVTTKDISTIFNFIRNVKGTAQFFEVDMEHCPFGQGVKSGCLDPFYTIAADLNIFSPGDVIYVPKVAGTPLPNGETHQGYFIVRDSGGAITGDGRFDFFSGFSNWKDKANPFNKLQLTDKGESLPYYRVSGETAQIVRKVRNFPGLPGFKAP